jgi:hypothetical protein
VGTTINSLDNLINSARSSGMWSRALFDQVGATTDDTNSGGTSAQRFPTPISLPSSFGGSVTGALFTLVDIGCADSAGSNKVNIAGIEFTLGSLNIATNVFSSGVSMPTRNIAGSSIITATMLPMLVVTTTTVTTSPSITITYTDQSGNTGNSMTFAPPANAVINSAYCLANKFAAGDTGMRAVTNMSVSGTVTSGTVKVMGLLPIGMAVGGGGASSSVDPLAHPMPIFPAAASDLIAFYSFGPSVAKDLLAFLAAVGDN